MADGGTDERTWEQQLRDYVDEPDSDGPATLPGDPSDDEAPADDSAPDGGKGKPGKGKGGNGKRRGDAPLRVPGFLRRFTDSPLVQRVSSWRTPGGLFPLIATLIFFLFAILPVNAEGDTRLMLIWRAMTGGAYLPLSVAHQKRTAEIAQASADNAALAQSAAAAGQIIAAPINAVKTAVTDTGIAIQYGPEIAGAAWNDMWSGAGAEWHLTFG